jgi:hypothetical protein
VAAGKAILTGIALLIEIGVFYYIYRPPNGSRMVVYMSFNLACGLFTMFDALFRPNVTTATQYKKRIELDDFRVAVCGSGCFNLLLYYLLVHHPSYYA